MDRELHPASESEFDVEPMIVDTTHKDEGRVDRSLRARFCTTGVTCPWSAATAQFLRFMR